MAASPQKKTYLRHGAKEPIHGVLIAHLKKLQKQIKKDHALALQLYASGVSDAMYLAALVADPQQMTKADLRKWVKSAYWHMLAVYTVPWVAAESPHGWEMAAEWIESPKELIACAGWSTYSGLVALTPDEELDLKLIKSLLARVKTELHQAPNYVRYTMNSFVIAVGSAVLPLTQEARTVAKSLGTVEVDMGDTACKVPSAYDYILKMEEKGRLGKKRKTVMC